METKDIISILLAALIVVITRYLVPLLKQQLEATETTNLVGLIENLVECAEQVFQGTKKGERRKEYVIDQLEAEGLIVDGTTDAMIEAAVYRMNEAKAVYQTTEVQK